MSESPLRAVHLPKEGPFTTRNPKVHHYNPITHLNRSLDLSSISETPSKVTEVPQRLLAERKYLRAIPRKVISDPVTGRLLEVSQTPKRTTFLTSGTLALGTELLSKVNESLNFPPRVAKTKVRSELYDPITNRKVVFPPSHHYVQSLGTQERLAAVPQDIGKGAQLSPRRRGEGVAYISPYQLQ